MFFKDLDGLLAYMNKRTEGLEGTELEDKQKEILAECPEDYGTKYRFYKATGKKLSLTEHTAPVVQQDSGESL